MRLLKLDQLIKTGNVDHADWNYKFGLGWIQRLRFKLVVTLLGEMKYSRLLDVGYGSGVFMPELIRHCDELIGIDIHDKYQEVQETLEQVGVKTKLSLTSIESTAFPNNYFDCIVSISALEFVSDIASASRELHRILKPEGILIIVTPGHSKVLDFGLKLLTGESAQKDYGNRREMLLPALFEYFHVEKSLKAPPLISWALPLYISLRLRQKQTTSM